MGYFITVSCERKKTIFLTKTAWLCILASTVRKALKGTSSLGRAYRELPDGERRVQRSIVNTSRSFAPNEICIHVENQSVKETVQFSQEGTAEIQ